ncbi:MAG TPA: hypothetical protein VFX15_01865 [Actinomycetes bacterium]|nr:hypothetical protein [Actinomycetes bacterium]
MIDADNVQKATPWARKAALVIFTLTVAQLVVAAFVPNLEQFEGKGFGARLIAYPVMMLALPAAYHWWSLQQDQPRPTPWDAYALIWTPFLIDVTGNTLDLYDSVTWWDDANHFVNWFFLCAGIGLIVARTAVIQPWVLLWLTAGFGALLAIVWEVGEYFAFIRYGTEIESAYRDTLGDEVLGSAGALVAGTLLAVLSRRRLKPSA